LLGRVGQQCLSHLQEVEAGVAIGLRFLVPHVDAFTCVVS
jgi:hypothetical protein